MECQGNTAFTQFESFVDESEDTNFYRTFIRKKDSLASVKARKKGNKFFSQKHHSADIHEKILLNYSKSVALAPFPSEELVLAVGNRSCLLKHLGKYKECIDDIYFALQFDIKSDIFKMKLLCRKIICLYMLNKKLQARQLIAEVKLFSNQISDNHSEQKDEYLKNVSDLVNSEMKLGNLEKQHVSKVLVSNSLPYVSDAVSFKYNEKIGRHLVANRNIGAGEILFIEEPICCFPNEDNLYVICSHCLNLTYNCIPCEYCVVAVYCSYKCKSKAWKKYHDIECSITPQVISITCNKGHLCAWRLFFIALKEKTLDEIINEADNFVHNKQIDDLTKIKATGNNTFALSYELQDQYEHRQRTNRFAHHDNSVIMTNFLLALQMSPYFSKNSALKNNISTLHNILMKLYHKCGNNNIIVSILRHIQFKRLTFELFITNLF